MNSVLVFMCFCGQPDEKGQGRLKSQGFFQGELQITTGIHLYVMAMDLDDIIHYIYLREKEFSDIAENIQNAKFDKYIEKQSSPPLYSQYLIAHKKVLSKCLWTFK